MIYNHNIELYYINWYILLIIFIIILQNIEQSTASYLLFTDHGFDGVQIGENPGMDPMDLMDVFEPATLFY